MTPNALPVLGERFAIRDAIHVRKLHNASVANGCPGFAVSLVKVCRDWESIRAISPIDLFDDRDYGDCARIDERMVFAPPWTGKVRIERHFDDPSVIVDAYIKGKWFVQWIDRPEPEGNFFGQAIPGFRLKDLGFSRIDEESQFVH